MRGHLPTILRPSPFLMFSALSEKLELAFKKLRGQGRISEANVGEAMKDIRMALLEADVDFQVTKDLVENVTKQSVGAEVLRTVSPGQQIVKIFHDELVKLLGSDASALNLDPPQRILMTAGGSPLAGDLALLAFRRRALGGVIGGGAGGGLLRPRANRGGGERAAARDPHRPAARPAPLPPARSTGH